MNNRIDKELVIRNIVNSRTKAQELIESGFVCCNGKLVNKPSFLVNLNDQLSILENNKLKYVSRGGFKLEKAIEVFSIDFNGKIVMDFGSSTGGFTDCALQNGASKIIAIDVGSNQMVESLRNDKRIDLYENTNFKNIPNKLFQGVDIIVVDVSFISLRHVIKKISSEKVKAEIICLIKPQFECGIEIVNKYSGVVLNEKVHQEVLENLIRSFSEHGFEINDLTYSPIRGGDGNIEYIAYFNNNKKNSIININGIVKEAFEYLKSDV